MGDECFMVRELNSVPQVRAMSQYHSAVTSPAQPDLGLDAELQRIFREASRW
ncbi:hypothetical protein H9P43_007588 [Blastocladiella emersonii ATCC 22665]|nr:hypothetical protein H9P43_007588 [Blastocladiella emersonii ATCC 22665]